MFTHLVIADELNSARTARANFELAALPGVFFEARLTTLPSGLGTVSSLYAVTESLGEPLEAIAQLPQPVGDCSQALPKMLFGPFFVREVMQPLLKLAIERASQRLASARKPAP